MSQPHRARYEYRVWGKHREAAKKLAKLASSERHEEITDCYLLGSDDQWNAKIRSDRLKLKRLIEAKQGFERWDTNWHPTPDAAPQPFDEAFREFTLAQDVTAQSATSETRAVFVLKQRRIFTIREMQAEVTKLEVQDASIRLSTVAIQGDRVRDLRVLLHRLGLHDEPNVPIHIALQLALDRANQTE